MSKRKPKRKFTSTWASVTVIGKRFGISGFKVNKLLEDQGLRDPDAKVPTPSALRDGMAIATPLKDGTPHFMWCSEKVFGMLANEHPQLAEGEVAFEEFLRNVLKLERETVSLCTDKPLWWYLDAELPAVCNILPEVIARTCIRVGIRHRVAEFQELLRRAQAGEKCLS